MNETNHPSPLHSATLFAAVGSLLLATAGCTDDTEPVEHRLGTAASEISGGILDGTSKSVVGVAHVTQIGFGGCTGSLLTPNVVLTALHCVAGTPSQVQCPSQVFEMHAASEMFITTETTFPETFQGWHPVREIVVAPSTGLCGRDVAIMILQNNVSASEATPLEPRLNPLQAGDNYSAVGFGRQGPNGPSGTRFRRDNLTLTCTGTLCGAPDFVYPTEWVGETGVCSGDSGGPAIDADGRVTGVASRGGEDCGTPVYGDVFRHIAWIQETTIYAAGLGGLTPPSWTEPLEPGEGGAGGGGAGGAGGATASSGSGFVAGDYEDQNIEGDLVTSCAMAPASHEQDPSGWALAFLALGIAVTRRRR